MATKIRLARAGSKKRPFYRLVAADIRAPRDGKFIEKLGTYNPLLPKSDENRIILVKERIQHWLEKGAKPTDRVRRFLEAEKMVDKIERNNPNKAKAKKKTQERLKAKEEAKQEALKVPEAQAPETPAAEAPAEETKAADAPAEPAAEAAAEPAEPKAPEAPAETPAAEPAAEPEPPAPAEPESPEAKTPSG